MRKRKREGVGKKRGVVTRNRLWDIGRFPRKSYLFFLTVIFCVLFVLATEQAMNRSKTPWKQVIWRKGNMTERASQVFEESSAFPNNPWKSEFVFVSFFLSFLLFSFLFFCFFLLFFFHYFFSFFLLFQFKWLCWLNWGINQMWIWFYKLIQLTRVLEAIKWERGERVLVEKKKKKTREKEKNQTVPITASGLQGEKPLVC